MRPIWKGIIIGAVLAFVGCSGVTNWRFWVALIALNIAAAIPNHSR
jgi:hypothetical protein